jgi:hypothetical protein
MACSAVMTLFFSMDLSDFPLGSFRGAARRARPERAVLEELVLCGDEPNRGHPALQRPSVG